MVPDNTVNKGTKGGGTVSDIIWQQYLGGDQGYAQSPDDVPPEGRATDHRDKGKTRGRRTVGVPIGRRGGGIRRAPPHRGLHQEAI